MAVGIFVWRGFTMSITVASWHLAVIDPELVTGRSGHFDWFIALRSGGVHSWLRARLNAPA